MHIVSLTPFLGWIRKVNKATLRCDIAAGITNAVIVLPQGVAFALIAGLPPEHGLYTAIVVPVVAALFGSSNHLISGPTTALSIVLFSAISGHALPGSAAYFKLVLSLTFLAGLFQLLFGLFRFGQLANFVSHTVVAGFTAGAAVLIAASQLRHVLGIDGHSEHTLIGSLQHTLAHASSVNWRVLLVALTTLLSALAIKRYLPRMPHLLIAMVIGSIAGWLLGGSRAGIAAVGEIPRGFPPFSLPDFTPGTLRMLAPQAIAIALLGLIEAVSIARSIAARSHQKIDCNQEFFGQGLSNIVGSFFSCYAGSGSFTRSGVNYEAGAQTPLAAVFASISLLLILLLVAPLASYLPIAAMGGIIMLVAYKLIDIKEIRLIARAGAAEIASFGVTLLSALLFNLEYAIYAGVFFSLFFYLRRTSKPPVVYLAPDPNDPHHRLVNTRRKPLRECAPLKIVRIDGSLYFGAISHVSDTLDLLLHNDPKIRYLLIMANGINFIDMSGSGMLCRKAQLLRSRGGDLYICGLKMEAGKVLQRTGATAIIGEQNIFHTAPEALAAILPKAAGANCPQGCAVFDGCKRGV